VLRNIHEDGKFITEVGGKDSCSLCKGDHYKEYVAIEVMNNALARTLESREYAVLIKANTQGKK
jgi:hypothetical protein